MEPEKSLKEDWFLWLLLGTALLMVLGYWLVLPPDDTGPETSWLFEGTNPGTLQEFRRYDGDRVTYLLRRNPDGSGWTFSQPAGVQVDDAAARSWVKTVLNLEVRRRFEANPDADYGFESSGVRFRLTVNGRQHELFLGGKAPTGKARYLRYGSAPDAPVFLVSTSEVDSLDQGLFDMRETELIDEQVGGLTGITVSTGGNRVRYRSADSGGWTIVEPVSRALNDTESETIEDGVSELLELRATNFYDTAAPDSFRPVRVQLELGFEDGPLTVEIGGVTENERLLRVGDHPIVTGSRDPVRILGDWLGIPDGLPDPVSQEPTAVGDSRPSFPKRIRNMKTDEQRPKTDRP